MKNLLIRGSSYQSLVTKILNNLQKTSEEITRQKVEMSWEIGRLIEEDLRGNTDEIYGKNLILNLERDTNIFARSLYHMCNFYKKYPQLPQDQGLNWSHYRILSGIEKPDQRNHFTKLIKQDRLSVAELQKRISEIKSAQIKPKKTKPKKTKLSRVAEKLFVTRGKLFTYKAIKLADSDEIFTDLGFNIFSNLTGEFEDGEILESTRDESGKYSFAKSKNSRKLHTYKAALERVIDGDTIRIILDLGFNIKHRQIIRLAQINAAEKGTKAGGEATKGLQSILENVKTLIVKTNKLDIYGRYIADVFLENEEGEYLSQILVDKGLVEVF